MSSALATRIAAEHAAAAASLPAGVVSPEQRLSAIETLGVEGLPVSRDENWKYANLRPLEKVRFTAPVSAPLIDASELPPAIEGYARYTFVDGLFSPALSSSVQRRVSARFRGRKMPGLPC